MGFCGVRGVRAADWSKWVREMGAPCFLAVCCALFVAIYHFMG